MVKKDLHSISKEDLLKQNDDGSYVFGELGKNPDQAENVAKMIKDSITNYDNVKSKSKSNDVVLGFYTDEDGVTHFVYGNEARQLEDNIQKKRSLKSFFKKIAHFVKSVANKICKIVHAVVDGIKYVCEYVINGISYVFECLFSSIKEVFGAIVTVLEKFGAALVSVFQWIKRLFNLKDIIRSADSIERIINSVFDKSEVWIKHILDNKISELAKFKEIVISHLEDIKDKLNGTPSSMVDKKALNEDEARCQNNYISDHVTSDFLKSSNQIDTVQIGLDLPFMTEIESCFKNVYEKNKESYDQIHSIFDQITDVRKWFTNPLSNLISLVELIINLGMNMIESVVDVLKTCIGKILQYFKEILNSEIPIVSSILQFFGLGKVTFIRIISLMMALPFTVLYKIKYNKAPFKRDNAKQIDLEQGVIDFLSKDLSQLDKQTEEEKKENERCIEILICIGNLVNVVNIPLEYIVVHAEISVHPTKRDISNTTLIKIVTVGLNNISSIISYISEPLWKNEKDVEMVISFVSVVGSIISNLTSLYSSIPAITMTLNAAAIVVKILGGISGIVLKCYTPIEFSDIVVSSVAGVLPPNIWIVLLSEGTAIAVSVESIIGLAK